MALYDSENNRLLDTNDNVLLARATFTVGTREVNKVFVGENEVKAIYIGDVLVYEKPIVLQQLATPTISLSGDILSIEEVENAEYYDIYVDGVLKESVPAVSGYSGDIDLFQLQPDPMVPAYPIATFIKFDTPPVDDNDFDSATSGSSNPYLIGLTSYTNKTKVYVWGPSVPSRVTINGVDYNGGSSYSTAVEIELTGDYTIYLCVRFAGQEI